MVVMNHDAKPILLFCKFENTIENPVIFEDREIPIAHSNLETLAVTQHVLVRIR